MDSQQPPHGYAVTNRRLIASSPSWFVPPPHGWRHPVTGRRDWHPDRLLITFGQYIKRSRYMAGITQRELSRLTGVDQGQISRLERALAPATSVERLVLLADALGRDLPLGYCPHEHWCEWQPAPPVAPQAREAALTEEQRDELHRRWLELVERTG